MFKVHKNLFLFKFVERNLGCLLRMLKSVVTFTV